jgi:hypothetical protein
MKKMVYRQKWQATDALSLQIMESTHTKIGYDETVRKSNKISFQMLRTVRKQEWRSFLTLTSVTLLKTHTSGIVYLKLMFLSRVVTCS